MTGCAGIIDLLLAPIDSSTGNIAESARVPTHSRPIVIVRGREIYAIRLRHRVLWTNDDGRSAADCARARLGRGGRLLARPDRRRGRDPGGAADGLPRRRA